MQATSDTRDALTIWYDGNFFSGTYSPETHELLRTGTAGYTLVHATDATPSALAEADIAFGQPDPETVRTSAKLRWIHISSAGYTRYDTDALREGLKARGAILTNSSHVYNEPCAQHTLAMMLALARDLPPALEGQWSVHDWQMSQRRANSYLLDEAQTVIILGHGAIGRRLAELLKPFGVRVVAVRRTPRGDEGVETVAERDTNKVLPQADHVVNILPESDSTKGFFDADRFARCKPGARFYNIGRGATVDQDALLAALNTRHLAAAFLDVTSPEPLPPDHALWTAPNCYITPHTAGGHTNERERLVRHFLANLAAFTAGKPLADRVF